jgi:phosphoglycolate phosphatase-like HAD superfamily hydrolase
MVTVAATYGYLGDGGPIDSWNADHYVNHPGEIAALAGIN